MSTTVTNAEDAAAAKMLGDLLDSSARFLLPLARAYAGHAAAVAGIQHEVLRGDAGELTPDQRRLLGIAAMKFVHEAATLPVPTAYAPMEGAFAIHPETKRASDLTLPFMLNALRALATWSAAGPAPAPEATLSTARRGPAATSSVDPATDLRTASVTARSSRELRVAARAASFGTASSAKAAGHRRGGCGCSRATSATRHRSDCRDPKPHCDCGGKCGGRGCGCRGTESCTSCLPRGRPATERCACGQCVPPPPESCEPWTPTCETRNRVRACLKDIVCDLLRCLETAFCRDGKFDPQAAANWRVTLARCLADAFCKVLHCIPEALCAPPVVCLPEPADQVVDCLPCSYAVEELR